MRKHPTLINRADMDADIEVQYNGVEEDYPQATKLSFWASTALKAAGKTGEMCIRITDETEMTALNSQYRGKTSTTNVLSFCADLPFELESTLLGDIIICRSVVEREASEQQKPEEAHWAHMVVHGTLHLLGYDHIEAHDADIMENLETSILKQLNFPDPY